jgi:hypothetical protein
VSGSDVGKLLLTAAAVYVGGSALGAWDSQFFPSGGIFGGEAAASPAAAALGEGTASNVGATAPSMAEQVVGAQMTGAAPTPFQMIEQPGAQPLMPSITDELMGEAYEAPGSQWKDLTGGDSIDSFTGQAMKQVNMAVPAKVALHNKDAKSWLDFVGGDMAKSALIMQAGGALRGAFEPSEEEKAQAVFDARRRYELQRAADRNANFMVSGIPVPRPGRPLIG